MFKKKLIYLSLAALLPMGNLAVAEDVVAIESSAEQAPMPIDAESVTEAAQEEVAAEPTTTAEAPAGAAGMSMEERWKERDKHYAELKQRAEEAGVMLPERPPWRDRSAMHRRHMRQADPGSMMMGPNMQRPIFQGQMPGMRRPMYQDQMPGYGYGPGPYGYGGNYWDQPR